MEELTITITLDSDDLDYLARYHNVKEETTADKIQGIADKFSILAEDNIETQKANDVLAELDKSK